MTSETRPNPDNEPRPESSAEFASTNPGSSDDSTTARLEELSREECLQLLASLPVGRLAVNGADGEGPHVVPVNYVLDGEAVVFSTDAGLKLVALRDQPVTFQVDLIDAFHRAGWSVMVKGIAIETHQSTSTVASWAGDHMNHTVRLEPTAITGRRIRLPDIVVDSRGYL